MNQLYEDPDYPQPSLESAYFDSPLQPFFQQPDSLSFNPFDWSTPRQVVYQFVWPKEKSFTARQFIKHGTLIYLKERSGREIFIMELEMIAVVIVNEKEDGTCDAILCRFKHSRSEKEVSVAIRYADLAKQNINPSIAMIPRSPDCPGQYLALAFFREIRECKNIRNLTLPKHSGWQPDEAKYMFSCCDNIVPQLRQYYPSDILQRQLVPTNLTLTEAAQKLAHHLPAFWKYKLLLAISITSVLLYFYLKDHLVPDQLFFVEAKNEFNARAATVILKNRSFQGPAACSLSESKTTLQRELRSINDGLALFRDTSYVEDHRRRDAAVDVLINDLLLGSDGESRHLTAIITNHSGHFSPEIPAYFLDLNDAPDIDDLGGLQQAVGEFHYALICHLSNSDPKENIITRSQNLTKHIRRTESDSEHWMTKKMLRTTVELLSELRLLSGTEFREILSYLKKGHYEGSTTAQAIVNEFRVILSEMIDCPNGIRILNQFGGPDYFSPDKPSFVLDKNYVNLSAATFDRYVLRLLTTTQRRNKVLHALADCGYLYSNNNFKRNLEIETAPGLAETFGMYSIPRSFLNQQARLKADTIVLKEHLIEKKNLPEGFLPIIQFNNSLAAGRMISDTTDEAESIYLSGQTRSGKTYMATNQAVIRLEAGQQVAVIDQSNAFCREELQKFLPEAVISNKFVFWSLNEKGLPVNVLSLKQCKGTREKKRRLESILMVAAGLTGDVQQSTLQRRLNGIVKGIEDGNVHGFGDVLKYFDESDPNQNEICARLETVASDLEGLPSTDRSWGDLPQDKIIVISTGADGIRKSGRLFDILLASLYAFKQYNRRKRMTVVLDELVDLNLEHNGPINTILRKGGKLHLSMLIASQRFSAEDDRLGGIIGNCSIKVFFRPMDNDLTEIAKHYKIDKFQLASLKQGECIAVGPFYSQNRKHNCQTIICGRTFPVSDFIKKTAKCQELKSVTSENSRGDEIV